MALSTRVFPPFFMENKSERVTNSETGTELDQDATIDDITEVLSGSASDEVRRRLKLAMQDPDHPYSYLLEQDSDAAPTDTDDEAKDGDKQ